MSEYFNHVYNAYGAKLAADWELFKYAGFPVLCVLVFILCVGKLVELWKK